MKKLVFVGLLLCTVNVFAQKFEGTVKWSMKMEITDPKQKAQLENAQKQMNDPANQAKMKEMQDKMNDPQFKAMMEANPQMKAQMERMMGSMASGGGLSSLAPSGFTIKIKDDNALTKIEGGMFASEILFLKAKDQSYSLDRQNKTYSIINPPTDNGTGASAKKDPEVKVTKTNETAKILNYNTTKYIVEVDNNGNKTIQNVWATNEIKDFDLKSLSKQKMGRNRMYFDKIDGVPLKIQMNTAEANMEMQVTEIKKETLAAADFTIPADYKEVPGMFR
jgi:hypothetical protein